MENMAIMYRHRETIKLWSDNPRINNKAAIDLAKIILKKGLRSPIVVWEKNMTAYKGNTTLKALDIIHAGTDYSVPCIMQEFASEADAIAYGIADNKASEFADWDTDILASLFVSESVPIKKLETGFSDKDISDLFGFMDEKKETSAVKQSRIHILCGPEDKEEIKELLRTWASKSGYEGVEIR